MAPIVSVQECRCVHATGLCPPQWSQYLPCLNPRVRSPAQEIASAQLHKVSIWFCAAQHKECVKILDKCARAAPDNQMEHQRQSARQVSVKQRAPQRRSLYPMLRVLSARRGRRPFGTASASWLPGVRPAAFVSGCRARQRSDVRFLARHRCSGFRLCDLQFPVCGAALHTARQQCGRHSGVGPVPVYSGAHRLAGGKGAG